MSYARLKASTKDIDLVLGEAPTLKILEQGLLDSGYHVTAGLRPAYKQLAAARYFAKPTAPQWDVYVKTVCRRLQLSPGMVSRATREETGLAKLRIHRVAPSDIFIFKSITERAADRDDMDAIFAQGIEWNDVLDEMRWQSQNSVVAWAVAFFQSLEDFAKAGNAVPILPALEELADREAGEKRILQLVRDGANSPRKIQAAIQEDPAWVQSLVDNLLVRGALRHEKNGLRVAALAREHDEPSAKKRARGEERTTRQGAPVCNAWNHAAGCDCGFGGSHNSSR